MFLPLLLLLSGDIETNPGHSYPRSTCSRPYNKKGAQSNAPNAAVGHTTMYSALVYHKDTTSHQGGYATDTTPYIAWHHKSLHTHQVKPVVRSQCCRHTTHVLQPALPFPFTTLFLLVPHPLPTPPHPLPLPLSPQIYPSTKALSHKVPHRLPQPHHPSPPLILPIHPPHHLANKHKSSQN